MRKADNLPPSCVVVTKSGSLNFLEPSGSVQACKGTALPLPRPITNINDAGNNRAVNFDSDKRFGLVDVGQRGMKRNIRQQQMEGVE